MGINKNIAPIIITGMHHSGIGLIAHYLKQQGLFLGSKLISTDINNPHGYLEDVDFEQLQSRLLNHGYSGCVKGWPDWGYCESSSFNDAIINAYVTPSEKIIETKQNAGIQWGWVDSRTSLLLDFWHKLIPDAKYLLVYRSPWEVVNAIKQLDVKVFNQHPEYIVNIYKQYTNAILSFYKQHKDSCILVNFNRFMQNPEELITSIEDKLNISLPIKATHDFSFYNRELDGTRNVYDEFNSFKNDEELIQLFDELNNHAVLPYQENYTGNTETADLSIVITTYNDAEYIKDALTSVLSISTIKPEIIIVDDGTTKAKSKQVLDDLRKEGYLILTKPNGGPASARNFGISKATSKYICMLDADDTIEGNYIIKALNILNNNDADIVYANPRLAETEHQLKQIPDYSIEQLLSGNFIAVCSVIKKEVWEKTGGFDEKLSTHEDWEFWINAHKSGFRFYHINEYLFEYKIREQAITHSNNQPENRYELVKYISTKHEELYKKHVPEITSILQRHISILDAQIKQTNASISAIQLDYGIDPSIKLGKFKELLKKVKHILFSPTYAPEEKRKWLQRLKFLFSSRGAMLVRKFFKILFKYAYVLLEDKKVTILLGDKLNSQSKDNKYNYWLLKNAPREKDFDHYRETVRSFPYQPKISIIMPVYDPPLEYFIEALDSILNQIYTNWELCIADDVSKNPNVKDIIKSYADRDSRIKYVLREENGHISANTNSALGIATGEFLAFFDHDDLLTKDALYHMVVKLNTHKDADLIYSDEDKIDDQGYLSEPHFKPDWSPDNLLTRNYINHFNIIRKSLVDKVGGFRLGFEGSQDHDLLLRVTEKTNKIHHIPRILYHWRMHAASAAQNKGSKSYATIAGEKAIKEALERRNQTGNVNTHNHPGFYNVRLDIKQKQKVSIIIPSKDKANILEVCLKSIYTKTTYDDFEIIMIDNNSSEESFFNLIKTYQENDNFHYYKHDIPFNYAELMNYAVDKANGDYLLLLNNDTEIINGDWIECMVEHIQRKEIGVVGAKLLYPNDTIQHAGVVIGLCGLASHTFVGEHKSSNGYFNFLNVISNYSAVTGACMMFRKDVYDEVGGFDENFAVEYNDIDFCLKVKDKGYNNLYLPNVTLYHHESISRGNPLLNKKSTERHIYEVELFKSKWQKYIDHDPCYNPNLTKDRANFEVGV